MSSLQYIIVFNNEKVFTFFGRKYLYLVARLDPEFLVFLVDLLCQWGLLALLSLGSPALLVVLVALEF